MIDSTPDLSEDLPTIHAVTSVTVVTHPETTTMLHLDGRLDRDSAPLAREEIASAIAEGHPHLILDVRDVPSIDGAGATSLLYGMHRALQAGGDLCLVAPTESVVQRLALGRLDDVIPVRATVVEALESLEVAADLDLHHPHG